MKKISREQAKTLLAIHKIVNSEEQELHQILNADYVYRSGKNEGNSIKYNTIYDKLVSKFLVQYFSKIVLKGVSNSYLKAEIEKSIDDNLEIIGCPEKLYECSCCGYLTIDNKANYDVCKLCSWEDDGTLNSENLRYSCVNGSNLEDYRNNFMKIIDQKEIIYCKSN